MPAVCSLYLTRTEQVASFDVLDLASGADFGAAGCGVAEEEVVEKTAAEADFATRALGQGLPDGLATGGGDFDFVQGGVGQRPHGLGKAQALQNRPGEGVEAVAADLVAREGGPVEEQGTHPAGGADGGADGAGGAGAHDGDVVSHGGR